ncbi:unnamed protein product [Pleuronectes platessa]|uniref:Uncharacterized protein n=1 Tax=Pleuronectes platessa TaxID=8262 RepID=A0A9N7YRS8_PLEPL|nr:unnamed protein product [Pleuronectes platessa]
MDIKQIIDKLNSTTTEDQHLTIDTTKQLEDVKAEMQELKKYDTMQVVMTQEANQRLKRDLEQCRNELHPIIQPTQPQHGNCPHGQFVNITGPRVNTAGEFPGTYKYGAWGRDPQPEVGKENWHWLVMMIASNRFSNYVRLYSSLSSLIVGVSVPALLRLTCFECPAPLAQQQHPFTLLSQRLEVSRGPLFMRPLKCQTGSSSELTVAGLQGPISSRANASRGSP